MAGAPGFGPGIEESKSSALPLGYAPIGDPSGIRTRDATVKE